MPLHTPTGINFETMPTASIYSGRTGKAISRPCKSSAKAKLNNRVRSVRGGKCQSVEVINLPILPDNKLKIHRIFGLSSAVRLLRLRFPRQRPGVFNQQTGQVQCFTHVECGDCQWLREHDAHLPVRNPNLDVKRRFGV